MLAALGRNVRVIEDCLNGRRTAWDDPFKPGRNGLAGLAQRMEIHSPLELLHAVETLQPKEFGRIGLRRIERDSKKFVLPFVQEVVEPGAQVHTDGSAAYRSLSELGYEHQASVMLGSKVPAHTAMPGVHRVASLLKRWLLGTHHGAVQPQQLDHYLDEYVFRFNRRTSASRGMLFYRLLQQAVVTDPVTYMDVVRKAPAPAETGHWS